MATGTRSSLARVLVGVSFAIALANPIGVGPHAVAQALAAPPTLTQPNLTRPTPPPPPPTPVPVPGQDLAQIDTDTAHFVQGDSGQVNVQVYNAPAGKSTTTGWQRLDPSLTKRLPDGSFAPANLPFGLSVAPTASATYIASLTNEGGVTLRMGLAPLGGTALTAVPGQQQGNAVVYPAPDPATTRDVAVAATASGFNVRVVLHNASESPSVTLRVALDSSAYLQQEPSGTIQATRPITGYGDSSATPIVTLGPEFVIGRAAAVDASAGAAAVQTASSASLSLGSSSDGAQAVSVAVDPTWLQAAGRTFPITITIPVATALSAAHTGISTTVNSCAPTNPPIPTDIVVGVVGSCTDQGKLYFNLPHVPGAFTVVSATLGLYAPDQSTATGVQVAMNGPLPLPYIAPSALDQSASPTLTLPVAAGAVGIAEQPATGSNVHTWDVTSIVRQWFQDVRTNGGLTLIGSGAPVVFQSPMGSGGMDPATNPMLSITYAPSGSVSPAYSDGSPTIYGLSGTFSSCNALNFQCAPKGPISVDGAWSLTGPQGYVRLEAQLTCTLNTMPVALHDDPQDINSMLTTIYLNVLTPVVVLTPNPGCLTSETPSFWQQQATYFATNMSYPKTSMIYFEIGNEPNVTPYPPLRGTYPGYGGSQQGYADRFAAAAKGISAGMAGYMKYRILTGGMSQPTADITCSTLGDVNFDAAYLAITEAEGAPNNISASFLGAAVHPYQYRTNEFPYYWRNYHGSWSGAPYANICSDLNSMLGMWTANFPNMPTFFTEDNWTDQPTLPPNSNCAALVQCEGTYLADLFTWLIDYGYANPSTSQVRLAWFTGFDTPTLALGVRSSAATEKYLALSTCPRTPALQTIPIAIWTIFWYLAYPGYTCY